MHGRFLIRVHVPEFQGSATWPTGRLNRRDVYIFYCRLVRFDKYSKYPLIRQVVVGFSSSLRLRERHPAPQKSRLHKTWNREEPMLAERSEEGAVRQTS